MWAKTRHAAAVLMLCIAAPWAGWAQSRYVGDDIVVKYHSSSAKAFASPQAFAHAKGLPFKKRGQLPRTLVVHGGAQASETVARLQRDPDVEYATRDRWLSLTTTPNDPLFPTQYDLKNTGQTSGTVGADIQATSAWDITTGNPGVIIAISDTGCELDHPDVASRIWVNPGEIPNNGIDDDGNGFIDDVKGWDFAYDQPTTVPALSHGTHTLSIAGAASNNGIGVAGVDWNARMMVVNGFTGDGAGRESDLVDGVVYAINNGAKIINQSWGDYDTSPLMEDMALYAQSHGALLVPAAGNEGVDADEHPFYPACLPYDSILSVGGSQRNDDSVYYGINGLRIFNYGLAQVDVSAAAFEVPFATTGSTYGASSGTSYAAPIVSGIAGLVRAVAPAITPAELKYRIMGTAAPKPGLAWRNLASGRADASLAVSISDNIAPAQITDLSVEALGWNGAVIKFTAPGSDASTGRAAYYQLRATTGSITASNWYSLPSMPTYIRPQVHGSTERILLNELVSGTSYNIAVRAVDAAGSSGPISNIVSAAVPAPATVFQDDCNTTNPVWTASGFTLAPGLANTGTLSWQDSPNANYAPGSNATLTGGAFNISSYTRPRLSFYLRRYYPNYIFDRVDSLLVEASTNGGASWTIVKRYHGSQAPFRRETLPLDAFTGSTNLSIRFETIADNNAELSDGVYIDDIRIHEGAGAVPEQRDVILETVDFYGQTITSPDIVYTGSWNIPGVQKSYAPKVDGYTCYTSPAGSASTAEFNPWIPQAGKYEVYTTWGSAEAATNVTYRIKHADGQASRIVDQSLAEAHRWASLGTYRFTYGRNPANGAIIIDASTAAGQNVRADAVRLRYAELDATPALTAAGDWQLFD